MAGTEAGSSDAQEASVAGMMKNLNLTTEEEEVLAFSDGEEEDSPPVERALLGKVLSPAAVHATAIHSAMKPAWGNPAGLKIRSIGLFHQGLLLAFHYQRQRNYKVPTTRQRKGQHRKLKIRSIGLKGDNLFVAQFKFKKDMERALNGSPWVVGKHVVLMQEYDECLKP
jgi:hypothetical protein